VPSKHLRFKQIRLDFPTKINSSKARRLVFLLLCLVFTVFSCATVPKESKSEYTSLDPEGPIVREVLEQNTGYQEDAKAINYYNLGVFYMERNEFELAEKNYRLALELDESYLEALNNLAFLFILQNRYLEAREFSEQSLFFHTNNAVALTNLGLIFSETGELFQAETTYLRLIEFHPNNPEGYYGLSRILLIQGKPGEALSYLDVAYDLYKNQDSSLIIDVIIMQGIAFYDLDNWVRAKQLFHEVLRVESENSLALYYLDQMNS
jgi:Tfp pilus assembly protein PilF